MFGNSEYTVEDVQKVLDLLQIPKYAAEDRSAKINEILGLEHDSKLRESYTLYLKHATISRQYSPFDFLSDEESTIIDGLINGVKMGDMGHNGETLQYLGSKKSAKNLIKYFVPIAIQPRNRSRSNRTNNPIAFVKRSVNPDLFSANRVKDLLFYSAVQSDAGALWIHRVNELYDELPNNLKRGLEDANIQIVPPELRLPDQSGKIKKFFQKVSNRLSPMYRNPQKFNHMYLGIYQQALQDVDQAFNPIPMNI